MYRPSKQRGDGGTETQYKRLANNPSLVFGKFHVCDRIIDILVINIIVGYKVGGGS